MKAQDSKVAEFAVCLTDCESRAKRRKRFLEVAHRLPKTDILFWICEADRHGRPDEALWRGFLAGHFGRASADDEEGTQSASKFLNVFEPRPYWTWARVSSGARSLEAWLVEHRDELKSLRFGNHRKYESHKPLILYRVIGSFLAWVTERGGRPTAAFRADPEKSPELNFDLLFHAVKSIRRFGRTGAFDLLCLLGGLRMLPVKPGSCYLRGSTGPLKGARKLWGKRRPAELAQLADATAKALGVPFDVLEDALCMWQKSSSLKSILGKS